MAFLVDLFLFFLGADENGAEASSSLYMPTLVAIASTTVLAVAVMAVMVAVQQKSKQSSKTMSKPDNARIPPHVHSWIPFVGSALAMGQHGIGHFVRTQARVLAQRKTSGSHNDSDNATTECFPVFTATILGDTCLFIADPADLMSSVFGARNQKYLDVLSLQKQFVTNCLGASMPEIEEIFTEKTTKLGVVQYHHHLFKGPQLESSMARVQEFFREWIPSVVDKSGAWKRHNLFDLVGEAVFKASTGPFLSETCPKSNTAYSDFRSFDKGVIPLFNNVPPFLLKSAILAREGLLNLVKSTDFWTQASPLMRDRQEHLLGKCLSEGAMARGNLGLLWASSGNSIPAVFWLLLRLLEDPVAWSACANQVHQIVANRSKSSDKRGADCAFTLDELDQMTLLDSAFLETLRIYQANVTARKVIQDFALETASGQTYWVPKGTKLMAFWEVLHLDPHVHDEPYVFRYDRFVDKDKVYKFASGKTLTHAPVIPFGGGSHLCPGRKFISYEARLFMAMLMTSLEFRFAPEEIKDGFKRPNRDLTQQGIGVSQPDRDPVVEIRLRAEERMMKEVKC